jgi:hypothetical protein
MTIQEVIKLSMEPASTGKIRLKKWLPECFCYVENGFVRIEHNDTHTGRPKGFSIKELLSDEWEIYYRIKPNDSSKCPFCRGSGFSTDVFENDFILQELQNFIIDLKTDKKEVE